MRIRLIPLKINAPQPLTGFLDTDRSAFAGACDPHGAMAKAALIVGTYAPFGTVSRRVMGD